MRKYFIAVFACSVFHFSFAQTSVEVYPTNWWVGMKWNKVQLMVHSSGIKNSLQKVDINYPGVKLEKTDKVEGDNYVFLDLLISPSAKPGTVKIKFNRINLSSLTVDFELKARRKGN